MINIFANSEDDKKQKRILTEFLYGILFSIIVFYDPTADKHL